MLNQHFCHKRRDGDAEQPTLLEDYDHCSDQAVAERVTDSQYQSMRKYQTLTAMGLGTDRTLSILTVSLAKIYASLRQEL
jgi:hypothetical protein